jgi:hypothetical protein
VGAVAGLVDCSGEHCLPAQQAGPYPLRIHVDLRKRGIIMIGLLVLVVVIVLIVVLVRAII